MSFDENNPFASEVSSPEISPPASPTLPIQQNYQQELPLDDDANDERTTCCFIYESLSQPILITRAGKSSETGGSYIVYTIRTGVRRRYSEFESLRISLARLFPVYVIPPIPEKHSMSDYAAAPTKAKEDVNIIDHRKRMLQLFLNRCRSHKGLSKSHVFHKFLDSNASWSEVLHSSPLSELPKNILKADPLDPANSKPDHAFLPLPSTSASKPKFSTLPDDENENIELFYSVESHQKEYENLITSSSEKVSRRLLRRLHDYSVDLSELGAAYNAFSLNEHGGLSSAIEHVGQAMDASYLATDNLVTTLASGYAEPLSESAQMAGVVRSLLKFRRQKSIQHEMTASSLAQKKTSLDTLEKSESEARRIEGALSRIDGGSGENEQTQEPVLPPTHAEQRRPSVPSSANTGGGIKILSKLNYALHGMVDVDHESTRRNQIGRTRESIAQLEGALKVAESDLEATNDAILKEIQSFQEQRLRDLKDLMISFAKCHVEWANKNIETWNEAKREIDLIVTK